MHGAVFWDEVVSKVSRYSKRITQFYLPLTQEPYLLYCQPHGITAVLPLCIAPVHSGMSFCEHVKSLLCACVCDQRLYLVNQMTKHGLSDKRV